MTSVAAATVKSDAMSKPSTTNTSPSKKKGLSVEAEGLPQAKTKNPQQMMEKLSHTTLLSAVTWDVFSPPPSTSIKGKLVPSVFSRYKHRRKLSVEVHRVTPLVKNEESKKKNKTTLSYDECVIRLLVPKDKETNSRIRREAFEQMRAEKGSNEVFTSVKDISFDEDDDDQSTSGSGSVFGEAAGILMDTGGKHFDDWKPKYRVPCSCITVKSQYRKTVYLLISVEKMKQEREFIFDTLKDANNFVKGLEEEKKKEEVRSESRLQAALGDVKLPKFEFITLLVEIVSGWDLPIGDMNTSDPYVVCMLGRKELHRTRHRSATLDPIWTIKHGSLFLVEVESRRLFIEEGLKFLVKDFDQFGGNETLGIVCVPPRQLYKANGERMEFKLQPVPGKTAKDVPGYLAIRCRRATDYDKKFMADFDADSHGIAATPLPTSPTSILMNAIQRKSKVEKGIRMYRVRPGPDPKRPLETEWFTKEQIEEEVKKPSQTWVDAGTGELGKIYLEILGCDDLPNMDTGGFVGNKTDAFVAVAYEDFFVRSDTIDDCLSPRWFPWSKRAIILNMHHPSSQIFLGVFDFDSGPYNSHDLVGRVSVDVTNLRPDTDYALSYHLYNTAILSDRKIMGKIHIRIRLEIPDERKFALAALRPPETVYINVKKAKDFKVVRETCFGQFDAQAYSQTTLRSYIDELLEFKNLYYTFEDAIKTLFLWRGHYRIHIGSKEILLPVHSFNAFIVAITLVENPTYLPSFGFFSIAWLLFAVMGLKGKTPEVWAKCWSFTDILEKIIIGKARAGPHEIKPFEGHEQAVAALNTWLNRIREAEEQSAKAAAKAQAEEEERLKELQEVGDVDVDISTKVGGGISIDPMRIVLYPLQQLLGQLCTVVRICKHIVAWEDSFLAFWIAIGSLILAFVCFWVPWFFIIRWTARIIVWTLFGPWMKLVDVFYFSAMNPESEEDIKKRELLDKMERKIALSKAAAEARLMRENAAKLKDMKKYMFGRFAMKVPILKQDRFTDRPLPESYATPHQRKFMTLAEVAMQEAGYHRERIPGQTLVGDMIPRIQEENFTLAPKGQPTADPTKLSKSSPGAGGAKTVTTSTAYAKIGTIVATAGVVTFFGVPILASFTEFVVGMVHKLDIVDDDIDPGFVGSIRLLLGLAKNDSFENMTNAE